MHTWAYSFLLSDIEFKCSVNSALLWCSRGPLASTGHAVAVQFSVAAVAAAIATKISIIAAAPHLRHLSPFFNK